MPDRLEKLVVEVGSGWPSGLDQMEQLVLQRVGRERAMRAEARRVQGLAVIVALIAGATFGTLGANAFQARERSQEMAVFSLDPSHSPSRLLQGRGS